MPDLQELEAIKRLKYRYLRCLDLKLWDEMKECFTPDAKSAYDSGKYSFDGREQIIAFLVQALGRPTVITLHQCHHPEIDLTGPATATGVWALEDMVIDAQNQITIRGAAFYRDEYVKADGHWKIKMTGYERTFEEVASRNDTPSLTLTSNRFAKE